MWVGLGWVACCSAVFAQHSTGPVEFEIDMRAEMAAARFDPLRDKVGIRGAATPMSWERTTLASAIAERPGVYRLQLQFDAALPAGFAVAHKVKVESSKDPQGGWEPGRNRSFLLASTPLKVQREFGADPDRPPLRRTGQIDRIAPRPSQWVTPREVQVWLPPGYADQPERRYPVLYLHDGQNVFDAHAAGAEWQVDEAADDAVRSQATAPMIVVAVASTGARLEDYTPQPMTTPEGVRGGGAARYGRYLVDELKPWIDSTYRTQTRRESTAVGGSSLGGLVSLWLLLEHGSTFGAGLVVSPSVWWGHGAIVSQVTNAPALLPAPRIWLDVGVREGRGMVQGARALHKALVARHWPVQYLEDAHGGHDEASWAARVPAMLRFLYGVPR